MIYIVAGNYRQASTWAREHGLVEGQSWWPVSHAHYLRGLTNPRVVFVGSYRDRPDYAEILANYRIAQRGTTVPVYTTPRDPEPLTVAAGGGGSANSALVASSGWRAPSGALYDLTRSYLPSVSVRRGGIRYDQTIEQTTDTSEVERLRRKNRKLKAKVKQLKKVIVDQAIER